MSTQQETIKKIAIRNADDLVKKIGWFPTIQNLFNIYDNLPKSGTDRQLVCCMLEHLGYSKCDVGGWILK